MYQYFKRQLKTPIFFASFGIHPQRVLLRTQNVTNNLSEARLILPEDASQRIRNMS